MFAFHLPCAGVFDQTAVPELAFSKLFWEYQKSGWTGPSNHIEEKSRKTRKQNNTKRERRKEKEIGKNDERK